MPSPIYLRICSFARFGTPVFNHRSVRTYTSLLTFHHSHEFNIIRFHGRLTLDFAAVAESSIELPMTTLYRVLVDLKDFGSNPSFGARNVARFIDILYTLDSASSYSAIQKLKP
jgi:hypothetical protein